MFFPFCIAAATLNDQSDSFHQSSMFLYFSSKPLPTTDFCYWNHFFLWHFWKKIHSVWIISKGWVKSNFAFTSSSDYWILAAVVMQISSMGICFYISNWDEYLGFIWGEDSPGIWGTWKYLWEGTEIHLSGYCMWCLKLCTFYVSDPCAYTSWRILLSNNIWRVKTKVFSCSLGHILELLQCLVVRIGRCRWGFVLFPLLLKIWIHTAVNSTLVFSMFLSLSGSIINLLIKLSQHSIASSLDSYIPFTAASQGKLLYFLP